MIRPYLRDLINEHIPIMELNNNNNDNNNTDRAEWKIQLTMQNSCISTSEPAEIFMGSNTEDVIDKLFNTLLQRF